MKNRMFVVIFLMLLSINYVYAFSASIQPPRMVLRLNSPGNASGFIDVMNPNNVSINVQAKPGGDIELITTLSETNMTLEPNQTKRIDFNIDITEPRTYNGEIVFAFKPPVGQAIGLASQIVVVANWNVTTTIPEEAATTIETPKNNTELKNSALIIIGLIVVLAAILMIKRRMK